MLKIENLYLQGIHINDPGERDYVIQSMKPNIVCLDKPQSLQKYINQVRSGESVAKVTEQITKDNPMFNIHLWMNDYLPIVENCEMAGVDKIYFIGAPSYLEGVTPLFIEDELAPIDEAFRESLMSLRLLETKIKNPDKKVLAVVGSVLQVNLYSMLKEGRDYTNQRIQESKQELYKGLEEFLLDMKDEPLEAKPIQDGNVNISKLYSGIESEYNKIRDSLELGTSTQGDLKEDFLKAKDLTEKLDVLTFKIMKTQINKSQEIVNYVIGLKQTLHENIYNGKLKEDILLEME